MTSARGSDRARRAAIRVLRFYPIRWRARYEREMKALLEDMTVGWTHVANLAATGVRQWFSPRAFGWPSPSSAERIQTLRFWTFLCLAFALSQVSRLIGSQLHAAQVGIPGPVDLSVMLFAYLPFIRLAMAFLGSRRWPGYLSDREIVVWFALSLPAQIVRYAGIDSDRPALVLVAEVLSALFWTYVFLQASDRRRRLRRVYIHSLRHPLRILNRTGIA